MKRKIIIIIFLITTLIGPSVFVAKEANAQSLPSFGGVMTIVKACTCGTLGLLISVSPPSGGLYLYSPKFSRLFMNYRIWTGSWVLGLHTGAPVGCANVHDGYCTVQGPPAQGIITMVGTS